MRNKFLTATLALTVVLLLAPASHATTTFPANGDFLRKMDLNQRDLEAKSHELTNKIRLGAVGLFVLVNGARAALRRAR